VSVSVLWNTKESSFASIKWSKVGVFELDKMAVVNCFHHVIIKLCRVYTIVRRSTQEIFRLGVVRWVTSHHCWRLCEWDKKRHFQFMEAVLRFHVTGRYTHLPA
jgi:hypothetical protein